MLGIRHTTLMKNYKKIAYYILLYTINKMSTHSTHGNFVKLILKTDVNNSLQVNFVQIKQKKKEEVYILFQIN